MASAKEGSHLHSPIWRESVHEQVEAELDFHIEMVARELTERGMTPAAARAEALRRFGDVAAVSETCRTIGTKREREMRRTEYLAELRHDAVYALRQLARAPLFSVVAVLTLALGIGATTAIFSVVQSVVLRPFSFSEPEGVVFVMERWQESDGNVSAGNYVDWREQSTSFEHLAAMQFSSFTLADGESPERVLGARTSGNFFSLLGVAPRLGRTFGPEEDQPGKEQVVVVSDELWRSHFAGDPGVLGRSIRLSGRDYQVIGVMPARFDPTVSQERLWVPIAFTPERRAEHDEHYLLVRGRLKGGVTRERAQSEMDAVMRAMAERYPADNKGRGVRLVPMRELIVGELEGRLFILLGAVGLVLLIACGNVSNLLLARGAARSKEIAIRGALGAGRGRIVRQMLTESLVLALVSGVVGLALGQLAVRAIIANAPPGIPRLDQAQLDWVVLAFAFALAAFSSVVFGFAPALRAARQDLQGILKEGGRGMGTARDRVRHALVVAEVALALTLLTGAGLLIRSAIHLGGVRPGFDPEGLLTARLALPAASYQEPERAAHAFEQMVEELERMPGVTAAAVVSQAPMGPGGNSNGLVPEGRALDLENTIDSRLRMTTPGYLRTMRIPLKAGRWFTGRDVAGGERVMVVSEALAERAWPNESALGKRIACCEGAPGDPRWKTVIGVVGDVRSEGPAVDVAPEFYLPIEQIPPEAWEWIQRAMTLVARGTGDPAALTGAMRAAVRAVDPALPLYGLSTMDEAMRNATSEARFNTLLLASLGAIGLLLAAVGIYGVIAYFVTLRTQEIGVRMALGASVRDVVRLLTWEGLRPVLLGIALGTVASWAATRLLRGSVYGVSTTDPITFAGVALLLLLVGLVASLLPARRATTVDPAKVLNSG
ncbi:MAG: ADOP family duplicated permease [Gemmatimonadaceae bacterium]